MDRQPETTIFNPDLLDAVLVSVVDRGSAAVIRRKIIHACQLAEQRDAIATETLRRAETLMSEADKKSRLLEDERIALAQEKEKLLRDAEQLTSLPETVRDLGSTISSALKETREDMSNSLDGMSNATQSHRTSIESSSAETSKAIRDIKAAGEKIDTSLTSIQESFEHGLKPEDIDALTKGFTDSVETLTESIAGIPAGVLAGLQEEMTLESFFKPFELRDKLTLKEKELTRSEETNQRLIDQLMALQGSKAEVDLLLQQEKERVGRRNQLVKDLESQLEDAEKLVDDIPELQRQLQEATTEAGSVRSLSAELGDLKRLYAASQEKTRYQSEKINRLEGQTGRIAELEGRTTKAQQRARDLEESKSNFEAQIEQLTETLRDAQTLHEEAKESFRERLEDKAELLSSKDRELENLRRDLGDMRQLQQHLSEANGQVHDFAKDLEVAKSESITYLRQLTDSLANANVLGDELDVATAKAQRLEQELDMAKTSISDAEENCQHLQRQLNDANALIEDIESQSSSQKTQQSLPVQGGVFGELADMYSSLAHRVHDIQVVPETLAAFDLNTVAVKIAPLIFQFEGLENIEEFLNSGRGGWHCLKSVVDGNTSQDGLESRRCSEHGGDCVLVCARNRDDQAFLDFHEPEL
ncbi:hypothetical protein H9Q74_000053 [Fusarium xylarioides]|nr:hypothetical protein H9Q71_000170 [Fusarium xylarioides]KAG5829900.1 hypothetical protein H9Q74_000053 [Fusarium xylarioides]